MTNREKYKDELIKIAKNGKLCDLEDFFDKHVKPYFNTVNGEYFEDVQLIALIILWLDEEYKVTEVDWSKIAVDTPILVKQNYMDEWRHRHFAKYENGEVFAFENGTTSWSADSNRGISAWEQTKLAEPQE